MASITWEREQKRKRLELARTYARKPLPKATGISSGPSALRGAVGQADGIRNRRQRSRANRCRVNSRHGRVAQPPRRRARRHRQPGGRPHRGTRSAGSPRRPPGRTRSAKNSVTPSLSIIPAGLRRKPEPSKGSGTAGSSPISSAETNRHQASPGIHPVYPQV